MRVTGTNAKVLGKKSRQHQMRHGCRITTDQAVYVAAFEAGIVECRLGCLAHEVERCAVRQFAVRGQSDASDPTHVNELIQPAVFCNATPAR